MPSNHSPLPTLENECRVFARYLTGYKPTPYVREKYCDAHVWSNAVAPTHGTPFDAFLIRISLTFPPLIKVVDAYSALFVRRSLFRKKLVLLLAILECSPPSHTYYDQPDACGKFLLYTRSVSLGLLCLLTMLFGVMLFTPFRLFFAIQSKVARIKL